MKSMFTCRWNDSSNEMVVSVAATPWMFDQLDRCIAAFVKVGKELKVIE